MRCALGVRVKALLTFGLPVEGKNAEPGPSGADWDGIGVWLTSLLGQGLLPAGSRIAAARGRSSFAREERRPRFRILIFIRMLVSRVWTEQGHRKQLVVGIEGNIVQGEERMRKGGEKG